MNSIDFSEAGMEVLVSKLLKISVFFESHKNGINVHTNENFN